MKRLATALLCVLLCLPYAGFSEDFLVSDSAPVSVGAGNITLKTDDPVFQAAIASLNAGSLLDALNGFARVTGDERAAQFSAYAQALLLMMRDDPAAAISLLMTIPGFLDADAQLQLAKALSHHRYAKNGQFGYVDASGQWTVKPQFSWAERVFRRESAVWADGEAGQTVYVVASVFSGSTEIRDGDLVPVDGRYGLLRNDGVLAVPVRYSEVLWTKAGIAAVTDGQTVQLYDLAAAKPIGEPCEAVGTFSGGYIPVKRNGLWGYLDPTDATLLGQGCVWDSALPFSEGLAAVSSGGLHGFIDTQGKTAVALQYTGAASFGGGLAGVRVKKRWGFIDAKGVVKIEPAYQEVRTFQSGLCAVRRSDRGLINTAGQFMLTAKYSEIGDFDPIYHRAWIRQNKLWGLVSSGANIVLKPTWSAHDEFNGNTLCRVAYRDRYGYVDSSGKARIAVVYTAASPFTAGYAAVQAEGEPVQYVDKAQRAMAIDTSVPVECRCGFIEARKITETETTGLDEVGRTIITVDQDIAFTLYDSAGKLISVSDSLPTT